MSFQGTERFRVVGELGEGGMGSVYKAEDLERGQLVAIKVLNTLDAESIMRFKREFRIVADLHHPSLVQLYELFADSPGQIFYTMELVEGFEIAQYLDVDIDHLLTDAGRPGQDTTTGQETVQVALAFADDVSVSCSIDTLMALLAQLLDALEVLHSRGIVHRDLKPSNILVDRSGRLKLVDFGVIKILQEFSPLSRVGYVSGTPEFMAPEQVLEDGKLSPATDMYALGCVLYTLLSGRHVFEGDAQSVMLAQYRSYPEPLRQLVSIPDYLDWAIADLLDKDPERRPTIPALRTRLGLGSAGGATRSLNPRAGIVGRTREVKAILKWLDTSCLEGPRWVQLQGGPGMGKTALLELVSHQARAKGSAVLSGRCRAREALPYLAFDDILDEAALFLKSLPEHNVGFQRALPHLAALRETFPSLGVVLDHTGRGVDGVEPVSSPRQLFESLVALFSAIAALQTTVIAIDDLHLADPDSLELLLALRDAQPEDGGWLLLTTTSTIEGALPAGPLRELARTPDSTLTLAPLQGVQAVQLLERCVGVLVSSDEGEQIAARTSGNPFLITEYGAQLATGRELSDIDVETLLSQRLTRLSDDARRMVELVALYGRRMPAPFLKVLCAMEPAAFNTALNELLHRKLLRRFTDSALLPAVTRGQSAVPGQPSLSYDLTQGLLRQTIVNGLSEPRRLETHKRLARHLEREASNKALAFALRKSYMEALIDHWMRSDQVGRVARHTLAAAELAVEQFALSSAVRLYRQVVRLMDLHGDEDGVRTLPVERAEVCERIADILLRQGHLQAAEAALADATQHMGREPRAEFHRLNVKRAQLLWELDERASSVDLLESLLAPLGYGGALSTPVPLMPRLRHSFFSLLPRSWGARDSTEADQAAAGILTQALSLMEGDSPEQAEQLRLRLILLRRQMAEGSVPDALQSV